MSRTKIAAEARLATRQIFASLPEDVRLATAFRFMIRLAYSRESATILGVQALHAMVQAGVVGNVFETPMSVVAEMVKKRSPALAKLGTSLGKALLSSGLKKYKDDITSLKGETFESVVTHNVIERLLTNNPLRAEATVPQAVKFLQNMIWMQASTVSRSPEFQYDDYKTVEEQALNMDEFMSDPHNWHRMPSMDLRRVMDKIRKDPLMQDDEGNPRMYQYLEGLSKGLSARSIAQSMGLKDHAPLLSWINNPQRQKALQRYLEPLLGA